MGSPLELIDDAIARLEHEVVTEEDVHEARKRIKELRALVRLTPKETPLGHALRDIGRQLSSSRDADAMIESFDKLRKRFSAEWGKRRFGSIRRALVARKQSGAAPDTASAAVELRTLRPRVEALGDPAAQFDRLAAGLLRSYRRARRGRRAAFDSYAPAAFHEWRKRTKDQWYQLQVMEEASPEILGGHVRTLHELTRVLGDHHDLAVLRDILRVTPPTLGMTSVALPSRRLLRAFDAFAGVRMAELEESADKLGRHVFAEKPNAWIRRLRAYWRVWREPAPRAAISR